MIRRRFMLTVAALFGCAKSLEATIVQNEQEPENGVGLRIDAVEPIARTKNVRRRMNDEEEELKFDFAWSHHNEDEFNLNSRIVDGTPVPQGRYPYLVALFKVDAQGFLTQMCGGSLVAPDRVLTAAHCAPSINVVVTGLWDYRSVATGSYERIDITAADIVVHPLYNPSTLDRDFAIIKLNRMSRFPLVKVNFNSAVPQGYQKMTVMGWGMMRNNQANSIAQETTLDHVSLQTCREKWGYSTITNYMLCATGYGLTDTCQGDSGGPMIIKGSDSASDLLVGLTSWGAGCADGKFPGVYSRVSAVKDWLIQHVPSLSSEVPTPSSPTPIPPTSNTTPTPAPVPNCVQVNCWNLIFTQWCDTVCY